MMQSILHHPLANIDRLQTLIEEKWKSMPEKAKEFLLGTPLESLTLHKIAHFWSSCHATEYMWDLYISKMRDASLSIALNYLYLGKMKEARAAMLNGSFMVDCMELGIERIVLWCRENTNLPCMPQLTWARENPNYFNIAYNCVQSPQPMETLLTMMIRKFSHTQKDLVTALSNERNDRGHSTGIHQKPSNKTPSGAQINLVLADEINAEEQKTLTIGSSTNLKALFNDYADKRGASLRSLRFSYNGKTLFLSSIGNRTPDDLNMKDQDVITVRNTNNTHAETTNAKSAKKKKATRKKNTKRRNNSRRNTKSKGKKECAKRNDASKTLEEHRADHSRLLSKLHEEVQSRLKEIRMRLNALDLERQPPKQKRAKGGKSKAKGVINNDQTMLPNPGIGGKAGKSSFLVKVGEVQNLYKTTKLPQLSSCKASTLDLHGCTSFEAVSKLDESLTAWVDTAMQGSYPFVISAKIVCGCGNQVLSETVENWIRQQAQVANSPKRLS